MDEKILKDNNDFEEQKIDSNIQFEERKQDLLNESTLKSLQSEIEHKKDMMDLNLKKKNQDMMLQMMLNQVMMQQMMMNNNQMNI
jgi:hypothetical protein